MVVVEVHVAVLHQHYSAGQSQLAAQDHQIIARPAQHQQAYDDIKHVNLIEERKEC